MRWIAGNIVPTSTSLRFLTAFLMVWPFSNNCGTVEPRDGIVGCLVDHDRFAIMAVVVIVLEQPLPPLPPSARPVAICLWGETSSCLLLSSLLHTIEWLYLL